MLQKKVFIVLKIFSIYLQSDLNVIEEQSLVRKNRPSTTFRGDDDNDGLLRTEIQRLRSKARIESDNSGKCRWRGAGLSTWLRLGIQDFVGVI